MTMHNTYLALLIALTLPLSLAGCSKPGEEEEDCETACAKKAASAEGHEGHDHASHAEPKAEEEGHEGHDHASHAEPKAEQGGHEGHAHNDMETPIEELLAQKCEHGVAMVDCDHCRYEAGAVKVDSQLTDLNLIQIAEVDRRQLDLPVEMNATVGFNELRTVHVSPRVHGIIRALKVDYGDAVKPGQVLFTMESQELGEAAGEFMDARGAAKLAELTATRQQELRAGGVTSEREYLQAAQESESASIRRQTAHDRLRRMGLGEREIEGLQAGGSAALGVLNVRSPQDGTVLDLHATPGEQLEPGDEAALVGDLSTVWVWADIYEEDLIAVTLAMKGGPVAAKFRSAALPDQVFDGTVDMLGSSLDPTTRTARARVTVDNADGLLRPGMFGTVSLHMPSDKGAVVIPRGALHEDDGKSFVFVRAQDDLFFRRSVVPGRSGHDLVEIRRGLEPGQEVVADGSFLLKSDVLREKMGAGCAH